MDIINKFFTETPSVIGMFYIIIGISLLGIFIFKFFPEEKALKWLISYGGYYPEREKYDWSKTLKRRTVFLFIILIYCILILSLSYLFSKTIAKIGIGILAIFVLIGSFFLEAVEKNK